jgi:hypothetical protein
MITLRSLKDSDIAPLDELWQEHWSDHSLPNRQNAIIDSLAVDDFDNIIGYGQVKLFAEAMLFLDPTARKRDKTQALKLLMIEAFRGADKVGIEEIYSFIKDPDFSLLVQKHYGFKSITQPGELLLRKL